MADKHYKITFDLSDGTEKSVEFTVPQGDPGADGQPGKDGYSPVRGTDYWTPEDVEAIKSEIVDGVLFTDKEYIQADGKAYILTDYVPNSNTRITAKMYFNPGSSVKAIFGAMTSTSSNRFDFGNNSSSKYQLGFGSAYKASSMAELGEEFEMEMAHGVAYINGEEIARVEDSEWVGDTKLAIFARNVNGTVGAIIASGGKIWWLKIYENDVLLHDFVARKHLVDGFGLYDRITKKFYGNSATSGAFTGA